MSNKDWLNFWLFQTKLLAVGTEQTQGCGPLSDEQIQLNKPFLHTNELKSQMDVKASWGHHAREPV